MQFTYLPNRISYLQGLSIQEEALLKVQQGKQEDTVYLLEHQASYTIGKTNDRSSLKNEQQLSHPSYTINRGGKATYHGPGQLVGYLIIDLNKKTRDLHLFIRRIESAIIAVCQHFHIAAHRRTGQTGVWLDNNKLASIGVGVKKWVTMHGFALNILPNCLTGFNAIVPCGIDNVTMQCLQNLTTQTVNIANVVKIIETTLRQELAKI